MFSFSRDRLLAEIGPTAELWQDREIRFDCEPKLLTFRPGEVAIEKLDPVEDTKGNNGERGVLIITNLRLIWQATRNPRTNLSIGLNAIQAITTKTAASRLKGNNTQALFIMSTFNGSRFEFIFTSLVELPTALTVAASAGGAETACPKLFQTVQAIFRSYEATRMFRDLKLRAAIIEDKRLIQLPGERIFRKTEGVWNLSSDQGNLGVFFITSLRVVWFALLSDNFNVSVPWIQIKEVFTRDSKFGRALVIQTSDKSGGFLLGFRIDPPDALEEVAREMIALHSAGRLNPNFGVEFDREAVERAVLEGDDEEEEDGASGATATAEGKEGADKKPALKKKKKKGKAGPLVTDDVEIIDPDKALPNASDAVFAAYLSEGAKLGDRPVVFNSDLGLAIEQPPEGLTLDKLWAPF
jgi:Bardet-Biedl syndrome 5 protein